MFLERPIIFLGYGINDFKKVEDVFDNIKTKNEQVVYDTIKLLQKNGIFIELKPNLIGLADYKDDIEYGESVDVYIKRIMPDKKKVKLVIV